MIDAGVQQALLMVEKFPSLGLPNRTEYLNRFGSYDVRFDQESTTRSTPAPV